MVIHISLILVAYLLGSISTAILVCRIMGLPDPRTQGSNNPGATNVLRYGGRKAAAITLFGDMLKGLVPVLIARILVDDVMIQCLTGAAAFLGHMFPVFFGFRGGKGIATAFGVVLGTNWLVALIVLGIWLAIAFGLKISSLAGLAAALCLPLLCWFIDGREAVVFLGIFITLVVFIRHHRNIRNLLQGTEEKISDDREQTHDTDGPP